MFHILCTKNIILNKMYVIEITGFYNKESTGYMMIAEDI